MKKILFTILLLVFSINISFAQERLALKVDSKTELIDGQQVWTYWGGGTMIVEREDSLINYIIDQDTITANMGELAKYYKGEILGKSNTFLGRFENLPDNTKKLKYDFTKTKDITIKKNGDNQTIIKKNGKTFNIRFDKGFYDKDNKKIPAIIDLDEKKLSLSFESAIEFSQTDSVTMQSDTANIRDSWVFENTATINYGAEVKIDIGPDGSSQDKWGMVWFVGIEDSLSGWDIDSALVILRATATGAGTLKLFLQAIGAIWTELGVTWGTKPATYSLKGCTTTVSSINAFYDVIVTESVDSMVAGVNTNYGWYGLHDDYTDTTQIYWFDSKESATAAERPHFVAYRTVTAAITRTGITKEVSLGTITKAVENGEIIKEVYP